MIHRENCSICKSELRTGDLCALDVELGTVHVECLDGCDVVDIESGEAIDAPLSTFQYDEADHPFANEPIYLAQVEQTPFLHPDWFIAKRAEAEARGCTFFRYSVHPNNMDVALFEGWEGQPPHQGEPRFMISPIPFTPTSNVGPVVDTAKESKRARRRRLAQERNK